MAPLDTAPRPEAEFVFPYLAHAAMEPLNCTVQLSEGRAEVWTGGQCPGLDGAAVARVLELKPEQVAMHVQMAGGGFGRRFAASSDFVVEACEIAKAARAAGLNAPVRTLWSREDDMRGGYYRPMHRHRARIGFDERGKALAWIMSLSASPSPRAPYSAASRSRTASTPPRPRACAIPTQYRCA